jgi:hypothetical protein
MTEKQLKQLALLAIQNSERLDSLSAAINKLYKDAIANGRFKAEASALLKRVTIEDAFLQDEEKERDEKRRARRAFFGLPYSPKSSN